MNNSENSDNKHKIKRLKRFIVSVAFVMLILPSAVSIYFIIKMNQNFEDKKADAKNVYIVEEADKFVASENSVSVNTTENMTGVTQDGKYEDKIKICLTFDDGPSTETDEILDILQDYGIKATFFVNGREGFDEEYRRIVEEGHAIGMHSYSHSYRDVYRDLDSFADDLYNIQSFIMDKTGVECSIYRFPGGSSNTVCRIDMKDCIEYLSAKNIQYYDWNVAANDAVVGGATVDAIVTNVMNGIAEEESDTIIILFHDSETKKTTVEALPIIIERIADTGDYVFVPINEDVIPVHHIDE